MKRLAAFIAFAAFPALVLCTASAHAQNFTAIKFGAGISNLHYKAPITYQGRFSWYTGFMANFDLQDKLFLRSEFLYSHRGYQTRAQTSGVKGHVNYSYLSVPVMIGYSPFDKLSVMLGPEFGYLLRAKQKDELNTTDITPFVNSRFNIDTNAGVSFAITPELLLETHFLIGLTPLYRVVITDAQGNQEIGRDGFHRVWQAGLVYKMSGH